MDFKESELLALLEDVKTLKRRYRVLNPTAGINDIQRYVKGQDGVFACVGGYRYFYLDWNLQIWRCEAWHEPLGSVFNFENIPDIRDRCTKCVMSCYRDTSVLMHAGIAALDAVKHIKAGQPARAAATLFRRSVATSLGAMIQTAPLIWNLRRERSNRGRGRPVRPQPQPATLSPLASPARLAE